MDIDDTKMCGGCKVVKGLADFSFRNKRSGKLNNRCKACHKTYADQHYLNNKPSYFAKSKKHKMLTLACNRKFLLEYLAKNPCKICGETDPVVLEFDHRERDEKLDSISVLTGTASLMRLQEEVSKCDVLCANCHRRKTAREFSHYRYKA